MNPKLVVNDIHSQLNAAHVAEIVDVRTVDDVREAVVRAREAALPVCVSGGRHAMGGQQFCEGGLLIDTRALAQASEVDAERGTIELDAGIQWPALLAHLRKADDARGPAWGFAQKQTGADRLSIGGAASANVHGRGLAMKPLVADIESLDLVDANGDLLRCSRQDNAELFRLVVGGYGLFGVITTVRLRLVPRRKLERVVEVRGLDGLIDAVDRRIAEGFFYGDFQFATDPASDDFLERGVFSCYRPVAEATPVPANQRALRREDWQRLLFLAHTDKSEAFARYAEHYLATSGQVYHSDSHQFADYVDGYHLALDTAMRATHRATEMITEIYVPRQQLADFMAAAAADFRRHDVSVIYGTVRLIERDDESFLAWARERWACIIFNICTTHTTAGLEAASAAFRRLIDRAIECSGSYFLTYHRWATPEQLEACYPQFREFLSRKLHYDPEERFQSDWYRHYRDALA